MHVGGVPIEDNILIIEDVYENMTMTPKGREMSDIFREGAECHYGIECLFALVGAR